MTENERFAKAAVKYPFTWCKDCAGLRGCFYQHREYSGHPYFLEPECAKGPMPKKEAPHD